MLHFKSSSLNLLNKTVCWHQRFLREDICVIICCYLPFRPWGQLNVVPIRNIAGDIKKKAFFKTFRAYFRWRGCGQDIAAFSTLPTGQMTFRTNIFRKFLRRGISTLAAGPYMFVVLHACSHLLVENWHASKR